jgi:uncharacterized protein (UPF0179 family)
MDDDAKKTITLVGLKQAKVGFSFLHEGPSKECEGCELFRVCMTNLEPGRIYKVKEVRNKEFPCSVHEEGVRVVEVVEPELEVSIETRLAFPSGIITFQPQECVEISCKNYKKCVPQGLLSGDRCKILSVEGQVKCPLNRSLVLATVQRLVD